MQTMTSATDAASAGEEAMAAPLAERASALARSRFQTVTEKPAPSKRSAIGAPMSPIPRKAIFRFPLSSNERVTQPSQLLPALDTPLTAACNRFDERNAFLSHPPKTKRARTEVPARFTRQRRGYSAATL